MKRILALLAIVLGTSHLADARMLSLMTAQAPNLGDGPVQAVDGGVTIGDDTDYLGARYNLLVGDNLQVFGELGYADSDFDVDGPAFGGGAYLQLPSSSELSFGVRGSWNYAMMEGSEGGADAEFDVWVLTLLGVVGGETSVDGLIWYANAGLAHMDGDYDVEVAGFEAEGGFESDTEFLIGGGLQYAFDDRFSGFVGLEHVDDMFFGAGLRLAFQ
jgi:hypothetical protein